MWCKQWIKRSAGILLIMTLLCAPVMGLWKTARIPAQASMIEPIVPVGDSSELLDWYKNTLSGFEFCKLTKPLVIDTVVVLGPGTGEKIIGAITEPIIIRRGGVLTINNPGCSISGPGELVRVEAGGVLELKSGGIYGARDTTGVTVLAGGTLRQSSGFIMDCVVKQEDKVDQNPPESSAAPGDDITSPGDGGIAPSESSAAPGDGSTAPSESSSASDESSAGEEEQAWELSGYMVSYSEKTRQATIRLSIPAFKVHPTEISIWKSTDGKDFSRVGWQSTAGDVWHYNFWDEDTIHLNAAGNRQYVVCRSEMEKNSTIWLKAEVRGSEKPGISNVIRLSNRAKDMLPDTEDDGSYDGNRGGGGQGTSDRYFGSSGGSYDTGSSGSSSAAGGSSDAANAAASSNTDGTSQTSKGGKVWIRNRGDGAEDPAYQDDSATDFGSESDRLQAGGASGTAAANGTDDGVGAKNGLTESSMVDERLSGSANASAEAEAVNAADDTAGISDSSEVEAVQTNLSLSPQSENGDRTAEAAAITLLVISFICILLKRGFLRKRL
ncbi:MAG: hypothetical protein PHV18_13825 [Lachnospiraceae bacterium]|nr:hypothetical protein [Lachnospiraceae bacterium]